MAAVHRSVKRGKNTARRKGGAHRAHADRREPYRWLGAGAVTLGLGFALASGTGVAHAEEGDSGGQASESNGEHSSPTHPSGASDPAGAAGPASGDPSTLPNAAGTPPPSNPADGNSPAEDSPPPSQQGDPTPGPGVVVAQTTHGSIGAKSETDATGDDSESSEPQQGSSAVSGQSNTGVAAASGEAQEPVESTPTVSVVDPASVADYAPTVTFQALAPSPVAPTNPLQDFIVAVLWQIQVTFFNSSPTARPEQYPGQTPAGVVRGTVGAGDVDRDPLVVALAAPPIRGSVAVSADGTYEYTPSSGLAATGGIDTFDVTITETNAAQHIHGLAVLWSALIGALTGTTVPVNGPSISRRITVAIAPVAAVPGSPPELGSPPFAYETNTSAGVVRGSVNATDPDDDALTFSFDGSLDPAIGEVVVDPRTGKWAFKATPKARLDAWKSSEEATAAFVINVSDGLHTVPVAISAPIAPAVVFDIDTIASVGSQSAGIVVDAENRLYIANYGDGSITRIGADGSLGTAITTAGRPIGIALGADGRLYVTDAQNGTVAEIDPAGHGASETIAQVAAPSGVVVDREGRIFVATGDGRVVVVDGSGSSVGTISVGGTPFGLALDADGNIYVTQPVRGELVVFRPDGTISEPIHVGSTAYGVAIGANGRAYVADLAGGKLVAINVDHSIADEFEIGGEPVGVAMGPDGRIYVTHLDGSHVTVLTPGEVADARYGYEIDENTGAVYGYVDMLDPGGLLTYSVQAPLDPRTGVVHVNPASGEWTFVPTPQGRFDAWKTPHDDTVGFVVIATDGTNSVSVAIDAPLTPAVDFDDIRVVEGVGLTPAGVAVAGDGTVYVASYGNGTLTVVKPDGSFAAPIAVGTSPIGVAVGPDGRVFVTDVATGNVSVIDPAQGNSVAVLAQLDTPGWIVVGGDGRVYVTTSPSTSQRASITVLDAGGAVLGAIEIPGQASGLAIGPDGSLYVSDSVAGTLTVVHEDGTIGDTVPLGRTGVLGVGVGANGTVYVADALGGKLIPVVDGIPGRGIAVGDVPGGVAVGADGRIYVTNVQNGSLTILTPGPAVAYPPVLGDPAFTVIGTDQSTGVVVGVINVTDPDRDDELTYTLATPLDPGIGDVVFDDATRRWVFQPTAQARAAAWNGGPSNATFTVDISDGIHTVSVVVTAPIRPATEPHAEEPPFDITDVDTATGVVRGHLNVGDEDGDLLIYTVTNLPSSVGSVQINSATGEFVFTPTDVTRYRAWFATGASVASFSVVAADAHTSVTLAVAVPVPPAFPDEDGELSPEDLRLLGSIGAVDVSENFDESVRAIDGTFTTVNVQNAADAATVLNRVAALLGASAGFADAATISVQTVEIPGESGDETALTQRFYRSVQVVDGIPVVGSEIVLVTDGTGAVTGLFSVYDPRVNSVETTPVSNLDRQAAIGIAKAAILSELDEGLDQAVKDALLASLTFDTDLTIYADGSDAAPVLAWRVRVFTTPIDEDAESVTLADIADEVNGGAEIYVLPLVDREYVIAANGGTAGSILFEKSESEAAVTQMQNGYTFFAEVRGSETVLYDSQRNIRTYRLKYNRQILRGSTVMVPTKTITEVVKSPAGWDAVAVAAHANAERVWQYFKDVLNRQSIDGNRLGLDLVVGYRKSTSTWDNAEQSGNTIRFGDGGHESELDVVGHEFTHGVVQYVSGLSNQGQPGALNEAYADILGSLIEARFRGLSKTDVSRWLIGDDVGSAWRNLADPTNSRHLADSAIAASWGDLKTDPKAVHYNSGIFSYAAYRMITDPRTAGISDDKWAKVYYNSLFRLPSNAGFVDARAAVISSAKALNFTRPQIEAIQQAYDGVGIRASKYSYGAYRTINLGEGAYDLAFSPSKGRAYVVMPDNTIKIVDTGANDLRAGSVNIGGTPGAIAVSADGTLAYVTNLSTNTVSILNTSKFATVDVGSGPVGIAVSSNGLRAYTVNNIARSVSIIEWTGIDPTVRNVPLSATPQAIALSGDGTRAFVTHSGTGTVSIVTYGATGSTPRVETVPVAGTVGTIAVSADGRRAVVYSTYGGYAAISVIDASGPTPVVREVPDAIGYSYRYQGFIALSADGKRAYVTSHETTNSVTIIDTNPSNPRVLWRVSLNDLPHSIATTANGDRAFVVAHDRFYVIDTRSGSPKFKAANIPTNTVYNSGSQYQQVAVSSNGDLVVTTSIYGELTVLVSDGF